MKKIKWRKTDEKELARLVKNFNAKITRIEKKGLDIILPDRISKKELKSRIYTRKDYNRERNYIKNWVKRGSEMASNNYTAWEIETLKDRIKYDNKRKARERKNRATEVKINGKVIGRRIDMDLPELRDRNPDVVYTRTIQEIQGLLKVYKNRNDYYGIQIRERFKENYLKSLEKYREYMDEDEFNELYRKIKETNSEDLYQASLNGSLPEIIDYYVGYNVDQNINRIQVFVS